ncbi:MAG: twin-arginine translocase TatA/TatE family subunit [Paludibacteraceae bacterium]|nr:twin-arginine translocase TatA/TatE family subunit [Paludibacteraceae bacterium]MBQ9426335.1 twin-arginine translocase TatA/TatE family subunit [Paludibacteraceae bacterium]
MLGTWEIILIVLVILLIFGGKKIPELMRGLGKGVKSFKDGVNGKEDEAVADEKAKNPDEKAKEEVKDEKSNEAK